MRFSQRQCKNFKFKFNLNISDELGIILIIQEKSFRGPENNDLKVRKDCMLIVEVHRLVATILFILSWKILTNGGISSFKIFLWVFLEKNNG